MLKIFQNHKLLLVVDDDTDYSMKLEEALYETNLLWKLHHQTKIPDLNSTDIKDYDIVFLDLVMSGVSEEEIFEFCKKINKNVPIIIVAPNEDKIIIEKSIKSGSHAFLSKENLNIRCIIHAIYKAIQRYQISNKKNVNPKLMELKKIIKDLQKSLKVGTAKECKSCSHAECRLNEVIQRLKLMA